MEWADTGDTSLSYRGNRSLPKVGIVWPPGKQAGEEATIARVRFARDQNFEALESGGELAGLEQMGRVLRAAAGGKRLFVKRLVNDKSSRGDDFSKQREERAVKEPEDDHQIEGADGKRGICFNVDGLSLNRHSIAAGQVGGAIEGIGKDVHRQHVIVVQSQVDRVATGSAGDVERAEV